MSPAAWTDGRRGRLAWVSFGLVALMAVGLSTLAWLNRNYSDYWAGTSSFLAVMAVGWAAIGALIVGRTGNLVGWVLLAAGAGMAVGPGVEHYTLYAVVTSPGSLPAPVLVNRLGSAALALGWSIGMLFLLFPTGRPRTRRWRPVAWALVAGATIHAVGWVVRLDDSGLAEIQGPWTQQGATVVNTLAVPALSWLWQVGVGIALAASGLGIVSLVLRYRRSAGDERAQLRWLVYVGDVILGLFLISFVLSVVRGGDDSSAGGDLLFQAIFLTVVAGIPAACAIAILKYRLYDIDVVIRKTVIFGVLAVFITVVYAAVVSLVSIRLQSEAGSFIAAAILAVLFAPARDRARKIADRVVYGRRATPYEVLAEFSDRVGDAYADEDVLSRMAQVLMEGTGASGARVLLRVGTKRHEAAAVGEVGMEETTVDVVYQGQELGALGVSMPASDPMNPAKHKLVDDLAAQAGLVLRNVKLIEELKASRQRLVAAQDEERRKLERNIHDGAQQQLVALAVKARLARQLTDREPARASDMLEQVEKETQRALEDLRDLARGIYPPLLADKGLATALEAQARKSPVPVSIEAGRIGRFPQEIESAVYFSCLEALQNVAKYAGASGARVQLSRRNGKLEFAVLDDGCGFDPSSTGYGTGLQGIADRLSTLGGEMDVRSSPGAGTTVIGRVPLREPEAAP